MTWRAACGPRPADYATSGPHVALGPQITPGAARMGPACWQLAPSVMTWRAGVWPAGRGWPTSDLNG